MVLIGLNWISGANPVRPRFSNLAPSEKPVLTAKPFINKNNKT